MGTRKQRFYPSPLGQACGAGEEQGRELGPRQTPALTSCLTLPSTQHRLLLWGRRPREDTPQCPSRPFGGSQCCQGNSPRGSCQIPAPAPPPPPPRELEPPSLGTTGLTACIGATHCPRIGCSPERSIPCNSTPSCFCRPPKVLASLCPQQPLLPCGHHSPGTGFPSWDQAAQTTLPQPFPGLAEGGTFPHPPPSGILSTNTAESSSFCTEHRGRTVSLPLQAICEALWDEIEGNGPRL